jgi:23S rRNA (pseudouridine1915-N3)-methyltransferase
MRIVVVAVGKVKERGLREAIDEYEGRIKRYCKLDEIEIADTGEKDVAAKLQKAIPNRARTIALEVGGERMSSQKFAQLVGRCEVGAVANVCFVIGGSYGLPKELSDACDVRLSLSDMILPHRIARLFLVEQIYRAFTILRNEPYSH